MVEILGIVGTLVFAFVFTSASFWLAERSIVKKGHCGRTWKIQEVDADGGVTVKCRKCSKRERFSWYKKGLKRR